MQKPLRQRASPDRHAALAQYRRRAAVYDLELALLEPVRRSAVSWLGLAAGDSVLDVGCGTGLSFEMLRAAVGPRGRIVGVEQSPEMIERARQRVRQQGWRNVSLLNAPVEDARITGKADAALFHFTHDILQREDALRQVLRHLRPGASVVASGLKWAPLWAGPLNLLVLPAALRSVSSLAGMDRPWHRLDRLIGPLQTRSLLAGTVYMVHGRRPAQP
jgi:ubiquinone/menaquinone biosynthesis C-methylase UbiE